MLPQCQTPFIHSCGKRVSSSHPDDKGNSDSGKSGTIVPIMDEGFSEAAIDIEGQILFNMSYGGYEDAIPPDEFEGRHLSDFESEIENVEEFEEAIEKALTGKLRIKKHIKIRGMPRLADIVPSTPQIAAILFRPFKKRKSLKKGSR